MRQATGQAVVGMLVAAVVLFGVGAAVLADFGESAGPEDGATLQAVAARPASFEGRTVTISGQLVTNDYLAAADARLAFVLGDDADGSVLVLPQDGVTVPDLTEDAIVRARGVVRSAASGSALVDQDGLLAASGADAIIEATRVTIPGGDLGDVPNDAPARRATIAQLLRDPRAWADRPLLVRGRASHITDAGFILAGNGGRAVFVAAPSGGLRGISAGERVDVRAELERLSRFRANTVEEALAGVPQTDANSPDEVDLDQVADGEGGAFLLARRVSGADSE